jgi:PAS domain S-box-containing protein
MSIAGTGATERQQAPLSKADGQQRGEGMKSETEEPAARLARLEEENAALRLIDRRHRMLLDSIVDYAVFTCDTDLRVTEWNGGGERLMGWRTDEILGQPGEILFTPEDVARQAPQHEAATAIERGRAENERWHLRKDGSRFWGSGLMMPLRDDGQLVGFVKVMRDQTERQRAQQMQKLLIGELTHRVKNTLSLVQALSEHTLRSKPDPAEFARAFRDRLLALGRAHDMLTKEVWDRASITGVVDVSLGAWMTGGRISADGPKAWLSPQQALTFSLALHELATNAAKYGALSTPNGRVAIAWTGGAEIEFTWEESGGPPVAQPTRTGFGSVVIGQALGSAVGGEVQVTFKPEGLRVELRFKRPDVTPPPSPPAPS